MNAEEGPYLLGEEGWSLYEDLRGSKMQTIISKGGYTVGLCSLPGHQVQSRGVMSNRRLWLALLLLLGCSSPPGNGGQDAGSSDGGAPPADAGTWGWLAVAGSKCGGGATAGIGLNVGPGDELVIFLQGGGACWNQGTCVPSLLSYGPVCYYNPNICIADTAGGTKPTATYVTDRDPFPADGGGAFPGELNSIRTVKAFDRLSPDNPFRTASFVFVPYCTGDLHAGARDVTYQFKYGLFDQPSNFVMHFSGATNMDAYLARLVELFPGTRKVWLTGSSAGGYGATLNFDRVSRAFPQAEVHLLADSSPFIDTFHFNEWRDTWSMQFPTNCAQCADGGLPAVVDHLGAAYPTRRIGLLSYDQDKVIAYYFYGGTGPDPVLNPPLGTFGAALTALEGRYDGRANTKYFVVPGDQHVLWPSYGYQLPDGGYSAPQVSRDGGTDLRRWIDAWATGDGWESTR